MPDYFLADVVATSRLSPSMVRVEFGGDDLHRFHSSGKPDEWIRLLFPESRGGTVALPTCTDGKWQKPAGPTRPYTVRKWHDCSSRLIVDFVAHEGGVAAEWALAASIGDRLGLTNAEGRFHLPEDTLWILLIADFTGLPAVGRILEELPAGYRVTAHVEVPHYSDRQTLHGATDLSLHWHESYGHGDRPTSLLDIARSVKLPDGPGYIWIAGEVTAASEARKHFRDDLGFDKDRLTSVGYWIEGQARG
ncbi:siderophore-interacting protein [Rhizobium wenxiniae]|uniref:NADPH-dependent ferric siderophore reductase n=1 Tax=Rhizobium wenxiniae TaxID=1737357 RepID=A0A7W9YBV6_9HYPH|nr:siderophore-interacting protein [Rhizobium wenxiniae]MBB6165750.1 NADPH-dependent ferric siderophore reductase [Rhizobium wenxiniae]GGG18790.1 siderophore-interacting protein [Rhizobium wenxiniae]